MTNENNIKNRANIVVFDIQECEEIHNPYSLELREQHSIENGDVNALKVCWKETYEGNVGRLANDDLRNIKNIAIGVITLSSRSAIRGGVSAELAFSMADGFIKNIEENIQIPEKVLQALHDAQLEFTEFVYKLGGKAEYNPIIQKAKNYISSHMHGKISVSEMAEKIGVNPNYLSALFSRIEHKTITQYVLEEKLLMCENMLKYSDYTIQEISSYFSFSSQSHFTEQFKKSRGMTPSKYRKIYGREK